MSFLYDVLAVIVLIIIWSLRKPVTLGLLYLAYKFADKLHKKEADKIVKSINKLDDDEVATTLKLYRRKFYGLKLFGLCLLLVYSFITANIVYIIIHIPWVWYTVFVITLLMYWGTLVRNISVLYLVFHEERMVKEGVLDI